MKSEHIPIHIYFRDVRWRSALSRNALDWVDRTSRKYDPEMLEFHSLLLEIMLLLGAWLCLAVLQKDRSTPGRKTFALATAAWMVWCFGELARTRGWLSQPTSVHLAHAGIIIGNAPVDDSVHVRRTLRDQQNVLDEV